MPVGGTAPIKIDLRITAATCQDLAPRVALGRFAAICTLGSPACPSSCPRCASAARTSDS